MSFVERRRYERRPFDKPIIFHLKALDTKINRAGVSVDISKGGLGMIADFPLSIGDILYFEDEIKVDDLVAKSATVKWASQLQRHIYRLGMEFRR